MTSRDFVYWLQGFYELSGSADLDARQTGLVDRHLRMAFVLGVPPKEGNPSDVVQFVHWLRERLDEQAAGKPLLGRRVVDQLNRVFAHDLDPSHSNDPAIQAKLNAIHAGQPSPTDTVDSLADARPTLVLVGHKPAHFNRDQNGILCRC